MVQRLNMKQTKSFWRLTFEYPSTKKISVVHPVRMTRKQMLKWVDNCFAICGKNELGELPKEIEYREEKI